MEATETFDKNIRIGKYVFNPTERKLHMGGKTTLLTKKESALLMLLATYRNTVVDRKEALELIWGQWNYTNGRSMDVYISKLRKHLSSDLEVLIEVRRSVGFIMIVKP